MFPLFIAANDSILLRPANETDTAERDTPEKADALFCAACRAPITSLRERISVNERHEHVFANPHGYIYQIGCFAVAPGCALIGEETAFFFVVSGICVADCALRPLRRDVRLGFSVAGVELLRPDS